MPALQSDELLLSLKRAAAALRDADIPFVVGGGFAAWARGGPPTEHDIDLIVREADAEKALAACEAAGMRTEVPPEGWLVKAWDGDVLIDLIYPTDRVGRRRRVLRERRVPERARRVRWRCSAPTTC